MGDFGLLSALLRLDFGISRDHFGTTVAQPSNLPNALGCGLFAGSAKFAKKLVQADQAHLGVFERGEMEKVGEFLFVFSFRIRAGGPHHAHARLLENAHNIIGRGVSGFPEMRDQLAADLLDLGRCESRLGQFAGRV